MLSLKARLFARLGCGLLIAATTEILMVVLVGIIAILIAMAVIGQVGAAAQKGGRRYSKGKKQDALHDKITDA
jgi:hypothetical protein